MVLYNEIEPYAAAWLRNLIAARHIADGVVEERSIVDLRPSDLAGHRQAHFFAGIGVWSHALRLAGVPDDMPVWTGSCPCQPFSAAGAGAGFADPRHLWPEWFRLIGECRPPLIFGEQVASPDGLAWLDLVQSDLEGAGYAVGAFDLCAAGFGAPHLRQRLYFVAYTDSPGFGFGWREQLRAHRNTPHRHDAHGRRAAGGSVVADADGYGCGAGRSGEADGNRTLEPARRGHDGGMGDAGGARSGRDARGVPAAEGAGGGGRLVDRGLADLVVTAGADGRMVDADSARRDRREDPGTDCGDAHSSTEATGWGSAGRVEPERAGATGGFWNPCDWIPCRDPQRGLVWRPVEPGAFPLAHGFAGRVGALRAYGNAIVGPQAAEFIEAALDVISHG